MSAYLCLGSTVIVGIKVGHDRATVEDLSQVAANQGNPEPDSGTQNPSFQLRPK